MATTLLTFKRGDRLPSVLIPLTQGFQADGITPKPVDLTDATGVTFSMRSGPAAAPKVNAAAAVIVAPAVNGIVRYDWQATDLDTVAEYLATVQVTWPGPEPQTFPGDGYLVVRVEPAVTDVPVFGASAPIGYVGLPALKAYPEYRNLANLVPGGDQAAQDAELANMIARASAQIDGYLNRSLLPQAVTKPETVRINSDYEALIVPDDRPFNRVTAVAANPVPGPGSATVTVDPATVYPTFLGKVPTLHIPLQGVGLGPGGSCLVTTTIETGYARCRLSADVAAAANSLTVDDENGFAAGLRFRIADPGVDEYLTVAATYVPGSGTVPLTGATTFAHKAGADLTAVPSDVEEACILWTFGLLPSGNTEDDFANAPVPTTSTKKSKRKPSGYIGRAKCILDDGGYAAVLR